MGLGWSESQEERQNFCSSNKTSYVRGESKHEANHSKTESLRVLSMVYIVDEVETQPPIFGLVLVYIKLMSRNRHESWKI